MHRSQKVSGPTVVLSIIFGISGMGMAGFVLLTSNTASQPNSPPSITAATITPSVAYTNSILEAHAHGWACPWPGSASEPLVLVLFPFLDSRNR